MTRRILTLLPLLPACSAHDYAFGAGVTAGLPVGAVVVCMLLWMLDRGEP